MFKTLIYSTIFIVVFAQFLIIFFSPRESYMWNSGVGRVIDCKCSNPSPYRSQVWIGGSRIYCEGIPYQCDYNPRYKIPFWWFVLYIGAIALLYFGAQYYKPYVYRKYILPAGLLALLFWIDLRILFLVFFSSKTPVTLQEIFEIFTNPFVGLFVGL